MTVAVATTIEIISGVVICKNPSSLNFTIQNLDLISIVFHSGVDGSVIKRRINLILRQSLVKVKINFHVMNQFNNGSDGDVASVLWHEGILPNGLSQVKRYVMFFVEQLVKLSQID